jgi:DNA-binding response OmpR family regulator
VSSLLYKEYAFLVYLLRNMGHVSRTLIIENVSGYDFSASMNNVDVHSKSLRGRINEFTPADFLFAA